MDKHTPSPLDCQVFDAYVDLNDLICAHVPPSRERDLVITNLQQSWLWCLASLAREPNPFNLEAPDAPSLPRDTDQA
jgi:hypothetical protein